MINKWMSRIAKERPVGTTINNRILEQLEGLFQKMAYEVKSLPFPCFTWHKSHSFIVVDGKKYPVMPSPFSRFYRDEAEWGTAGSLKELKSLDCRKKIVFLHSQLTKASLQPKDYPFYYPNEHKELIDALEDSGVAAIVAVTGEHPIYGLKPFYLFEDGNFKVPSAYISYEEWKKMKPVFKSNSLKLVIDSHIEQVRSRQLIAQKEAKNAKGNILVCAHMDSKYETPGALDNAAGLVMMMQTMELLKKENLNYAIDFVPFNSEEYYEATGELIYLNDCKRKNKEFALVINIDSVGHVGSGIALSTCNMDSRFAAILEKLCDDHPMVAKGPEWYSGDHAIYAFKCVASLAVTSQDFFSGGLKRTHTPKDIKDMVDYETLALGAKFIAKLLRAL
ncbi:M28 family metallopeptidase [Enterococcus raffinosus]|uniref:M28 family metallopeptidase n=1 Tax=Enterococcus raffinosus TaxID=71452 RepID=UPI00076413CF|nr:M28 family peptidase [Enterococcus raffinosus]OJG85564.1 aminopeptidase [Enterococcus raffinosus]